MMLLSCKRERTSMEDSVLMMKFSGFLSWYCIRISLSLRMVLRSLRQKKSSLEASGLLLDCMNLLTRMRWPWFLVILN